MLGAAGLAATIGAPVASAIDRAMALTLAGGIVKVEVLLEDGRQSFGTGTVVARERVVTACHVVQRAERIHVVHAGVRRLVGSERADMDHDLCLLGVPGLEALPPPIGRATRLEVGATVLALGFTGGVGLSPAVGAVENLHRLDGAPVVQCDAGFSSGASGGALFDEHGSLVAILLFRQRGPGPRFFAVPVEWFEPWIGVETVYGPVGPVEGTPFWARPVERLPRFMQAVNLAAEGRWTDLLEFAGWWRDADLTNAEGAYWQGIAAEQLQRDDVAVVAYRDALSRDAGHALSWYRLGRAYLRIGRADEARALVPGLLRASEPLARQLIQDLPELPD